MNNDTTDYDIMLSQAQTYTTELQGLLRALDASLDEFMIVERLVNRTKP